MILRKALAVVLGTLLAVPLWAGPEVVGTIASSESASVRGANAIPGSTLFSGDTLAVGTSGDARISLVGGSMAQVAQNSQARLLRVNKAVQLEVIQGRVTFRSASPGSIEGLVGDATFRPASSTPSVGLISYMNSNTAFLYAQQGEWLIATEHDGHSVLLRQGEGIEARLEPATAAGPADSEPPTAKGRNKVFYTVLIGGILIATTIAIALLLGQNEKSVSFQQKQNAVSPIIP